MNRIATYTWHPGTDRWAWDGAMYRLYGYAEGAVAPTRPLFVAHSHPGDRERLRDALSAVAVHGDAFACRHRIRAEDGAVRPVVTLGRVVRAERSALRGPQVHGYVVDVSPPLCHRAVGYGDPGDELSRAAAVLRDRLGLTVEAGSDLLDRLAEAHGLPRSAVASRVVDVPHTFPAGSAADVALLLESLSPGGTSPSECMTHVTLRG